MRDSGHDPGVHALSAGFPPWVIKSGRFLDDWMRP
jgi:hypothetical protein